MALIAGWVEALRPVKGSVRLILLRLVLALLAGALGVAAGAARLGDTVSRRPVFVEASDPLPVAELSAFLGRFPAEIWAALAGGVLLGFGAHLLLTAGALDLLARRPDGRARVLRTVVGAGAAHLWAFLRLALLGLVLLALGAKGLAELFEKLGEVGERAGWTAETLIVRLGLARAGLTVAWATLVGLFVLWGRVIVVAESRRLVRRLPAVVLRLWWRRPVRAVGVHGVLAVTLLLVQGAILAAWRQSPAPPWGWIALWLLGLLVAAFVWHWRLRASLLIWASPDLDDLRAVPDAPWGIFRRLERVWSRFRRGGVEGGRALSHDPLLSCASLNGFTRGHGSGSDGEGPARRYVGQGGGSCRIQRRPFSSSRSIGSGRASSSP